MSWPFALAIVLAAGALVHWPSLRTFFAQDDVTFLARAMGLAATPWSLPRLLSTGLTWRAAYALFGLNPLPYHILNFVLHLTSAALIAAIGRRLGLRRGGSLVAALLFAATPIAFTPTHWASCIQEVLATVLALTAFWLWLAGRERGGVGAHHRHAARDRVEDLAGGAGIRRVHQRFLVGDARLRLTHAGFGDVQ